MVNYFELYHLPESFHPDAAAIKKKYYELSRIYHPDRFIQTDERQRAEALRMAAVNNDAYKTLSNSDTIMAYVLKLYGKLEDEEKYSLPSSFLMEMMDLNELVSEYEVEPGSDILKEQVKETMADQMQQWQDKVDPLLQKFDSGMRDDDLLLRIKDYYFRKKYLLRIHERINTFASR